MAQKIIDLGDNTVIPAIKGEPLTTGGGKINDNFTELYNRGYFTVDSDDTFTVPTNASFVTGLEVIGTMKGFSLDTVNEAVENVSGRTLNMTGMVSFQLERTGGGDTILWFYSESSTDGITWTKNAKSLREIKIGKDGVDYKSGFSFTQVPWNNGVKIRFMFEVDTANSLEFLSVNNEFGGDTVTSHAFVWNMSEH